VEDLPRKVTKSSDLTCKENFFRTTTRDDNGRYVVNLPFRDPKNRTTPKEVLKPESTTTNMRVVFNASSPSENGVSLNDIR